MMSVMCRPTASAAVQPKMRSAAGFQDVMMPSSVLLTMTSSDDSTMAARRARVKSSGSSSPYLLCTLNPGVRLWLEETPHLGQCGYDKGGLKAYQISDEKSASRLSGMMTNRTCFSRQMGQLSTEDQTGAEALCQRL